MNKYYKTYIRINTPSYYNQYGCGWDNQEQKEQFEKAVQELINKLGYKLEEKSNCHYRYGKNTDIYFHPQEISGIIDAVELGRLLMYIDNDIFQVIKRQDGTAMVDIYDEYFDYSEQEYIQEILKKEEEIKNKIVELLKTNRKNQYKNINNVLSIIEREFNIKTLKGFEQPLTTLFYICIDELLNENLIKKYPYEENLYRALQKSELKTRKAA